MLLKHIYTTLAIIVSLVHISAHAEDASLLENGVYKLTSGEEALCPSFIVKESKSPAKQIAISSLYVFSTKNSTKTIESDLDPECEFKEENRRENEGSKVVLTRINEEICRGKVVSKTKSIATISSEEVSVHHVVDESEPSICIWRNK